MHRNSAYKFCFVRFNTKPVVPFEVCSGCSYLEVLGESSSNNTTAHHLVETIVVSMGQLNKSVVNTRAEM